MSLARFLAETGGFISGTAGLALIIEGIEWKLLPDILVGIGVILFTLIFPFLIPKRWL